VLLLYIGVVRVGLYFLGAPKSKKATEMCVYTLPFFVLTPLALVEPVVGFVATFLAVPYQGYLIVRNMRKDRIIDLDEEVQLAKNLIFLNYAVMSIAVFIYLRFF